MKLSNKILIGFFGFILVYMIVAFTEIRLNGTPNSIHGNIGIMDSIDITGIKYIDFNNVNNSHFSIKSAADVPSRIEVWSEKGGAASNIKYSVTNDTLRITQVVEDENHINSLRITVQPGQLNYLSMVNSRVTVTELDQESLNISQKDGYFSLMNCPDLNEVRMNAGPGSSADFNSLDLDKLEFLGDNASVRLYVPIKHLQGSIKNNTYIYVQSVEDIQFKKDNSSRLNIN
ncbi:hypothetical protein [Fulvivirga ligni]|uniref:hypothetical protein n=1 Tax=Fulvivirga ligni TaxID=2904246 RepID=UPI001F2323CB|nr:hypothetical protein [Fulvivirga ligni]UII19422.1 hypothetical protein LVD16_16405 [Fulvivirga ligni]